MLGMPRVAGMHLENIVIDAADPQLVGRFWEAALGCEQLTDETEGYETRLSIPDGPTLDLCFPRVPDASSGQLRLHIDLLGGAHQQEVVDRLVSLGAAPLDIGQGGVPWVVLADPEGNAFCVMEERPAYAGTGPIAALPLDSTDPDRDAEVWRWLTGWVDSPGVAPRSLRHPSMIGPLLELVHESSPKGSAKNRIHLDVRLGAGDDPDAVVAELTARGGREIDLGQGPLPWRTCADPSGNELCLLPFRP
jgi:hypothetical protein